MDVSHAHHPEIGENAMVSDTSLKHRGPVFPGSPASAVVSPHMVEISGQTVYACRLQNGQLFSVAPSDGTSAMVLVRILLVDLHGFLSAILVDFDVLRRIADGLTRA